MMPTSQLLNDTTFIHVPKTAGSTVTFILQKLRLIVKSYPTPHPHLDELEPTKFKFSFVRHPWSWLKSYYSYMTHIGWENSLWNEYAANTFERFLCNVYAYNCPMVGTRWDPYIGPKGNRIDFIGRQEHLIDDLELAFSYAGFEYDRNYFETIKNSKFNLSPVVNTKVSKELKNHILDIEQDLIFEFYNRNTPKISPLFGL